MTAGTLRRYRWIRALLLAFALAGAVILIREPLGARQSADFTLDFSAARLVLEGHPEAVYDQARLARAEQEIAPGLPIDPRLPFDHPLAATLPSLLLSPLPLDAAFRVWQVSALGLLIAALIVLAREIPLGTSGLRLGILALLAAPPTWATLAEGQLSAALPLGAALLVVAARSSRFWPAFAGGGLLALKPQYVPAFLVLLLGLRRWRGLCGASAGSAVVGFSSLLAGGLQGPAAMLQAAVLSSQEVPLRLSESWIGPLASVLPQPVTDAAAAALLGLSLLGVLLLAWHSAATRPAVYALAGVVAVLASPHALFHDLVLLMIPAWLAWSMFRRGELPSPLPALAVLFPGFLVDALGGPIPITPVVMTGVLAGYVWAFRRRAGQPPRAIPEAA